MITELILVHVGLSTIRVKHLKHLKFLNLNQNEFLSLEGISGCASLTSLYMCDNRLTGSLSRSQLRGLRSLQTFWVAGNYLTSLKAIGALRALKDLNVANNRVERVSWSDVRALTKTLHHVNLSKNLISCFADVLDLRHIQALRELELSDPDFGRVVLCVYTHPQKDGLDVG